MSKLIHDRKDISQTIDRLIELGFKKGSLLDILPVKNYHTIMRRYEDGKYSEQDVFIFNDFKDELNYSLLLISPVLWVQDLFQLGLTRQHIYKNVLGLDSYNFHKLLKNNDFSKAQLTKLNQYKKELKKAIK